GTALSPLPPIEEGNHTGEPGYGKPDPCGPKTEAVTVWFGPPQASGSMLQLVAEVTSDDEVPSPSVTRVAFDERTTLLCALGEGRCMQLLTEDSAAGGAIRQWLETKVAADHPGRIEIQVFQALKCGDKP